MSRRPIIGRLKQSFPTAYLLDIVSNLHILPLHMKKPFNYHGHAYAKSLVGDKRQAKWRAQRKKRGFDDTETWSLRDSFTAYILPRLRRYRETRAGYPGCFNSREEWDAILGQMIAAFEIVEKETGVGPVSKKEWRQYERGMRLFAKWYMALWW